MDEEDGGDGKGDDEDNEDYGEGDDEDNEHDGRRAAYAKRKRKEREGHRSSLKTPLNARLLLASGDNSEFVQNWIDERVERLSKLYVKGG